VGRVAAEDKYSGAVDAFLTRSRVLPVLVGAGAFATVALLAATPLPLGAALLLGTWVACLSLHALDRARRVRSIALDREGVLVVQGRAGRLCEGSFVAPWLTVVRWRPAGARFDHTLLVLPDMLGHDDFRKLRVLLRWG